MFKSLQIIAKSFPMWCPKGVTKLLNQCHKNACQTPVPNPSSIKLLKFNGILSPFYYNCSYCLLKFSGTPIGCWVFFFFFFFRNNADTENLKFGTNNLFIYLIIYSKSYIFHMTIIKTECLKNINETESILCL